MGEHNIAKKASGMIGLIKTECLVRKMFLIAETLVLWRTRKYCRNTRKVLARIEFLVHHLRQTTIKTQRIFLSNF